MGFSRPKPTWPFMTRDPIEEIFLGSVSKYNFQKVKTIQVGDTGSFLCFGVRPPPLPHRLMQPVAALRTKLPLAARTLWPLYGWVGMERHWWDVKEQCQIMVLLIVPPFWGTRKGFRMFFFSETEVVWAKPPSWSILMLNIYFMVSFISIVYMIPAVLVDSNLSWMVEVSKCEPTRSTY